MSANHHSYRDRTLVLLLASAWLFTAGSADGQSLADTVNKYTAMSEFVFVGKVVSVNSSTMPLPGASGLSIVRATVPLLAPDDYPLNTPQDLTVQAASLVGWSSGDVRVFFANAWIFGQTIAFRLIGSQPLSPDSIDYDTLGILVRSAFERREQHMLQGRVSSAPYVVKGRVIATRVDSLLRQSFSEHDPMWLEAQIVVDDTLKGVLPDSAADARMDRILPDTAIVVFVNNLRWQDALQLDTTYAGYFILRDSLPAPFGVPHPALVDYRDFRRLGDSTLVELVVTLGSP